VAGETSSRCANSPMRMVSHETTRRVSAKIANKEIGDLSVPSVPATPRALIRSPPTHLLVILEILTNGFAIVK
jgi:hypothetical protein